jgi:hypothetical protein
MTQDNEVWSAVLGGLVGALLASPKSEDKQDLKEYRSLKQEITIRQQKIGIFPDFSKLNQKPQYYNTFIESYKAYSFGLFRSSVIVASALIESMLKEKFGDKKFYDLIEEAKKQKIISEMEYYLLHGLRSERNDSAHGVLREIQEGDAIMILQITIKVIGKLI